MIGGFPAGTRTTGGGDMAGGTTAGATTPLVPGSFCSSGVIRNDVGAIALAPCMTFCEFIASAVIAAVAAFSFVCFVLESAEASSTCGIELHPQRPRGGHAKEGEAKAPRM